MKVSAVAPRLLLTPEVDQRIRHWTDIAAGEVSCLGLADQVEDGFLVSEIYLLRQSCGPAETEIDQEAVAVLLTELDAAGIDIARLRFWFHSHANFSVFWSGTDHGTVDVLATGEWLASLVVNKAGARLARLDVTRPVRATLDEIPVDVVTLDLGLREECEARFRECVTEVVTPVLVSMKAGTPAERKLIRDGRLSAPRPLGLDWDDLDDLLDPELGDGRHDVGR